MSASAPSVALARLRRVGGVVVATWDGERHEIRADTIRRHSGEVWGLSLDQVELLLSAVDVPGHMPLKAAERVDVAEATYAGPVAPSNALTEALIQVVEQGFSEEYTQRAPLEDYQAGDFTYRVTVALERRDR